MSVLPDSNDTFEELPRVRIAGPLLRACIVLVASFAAVGCYDQIVIPAEESEGERTVSNDEEELGDRVTYSDEDVPIDSSAAPALGPSAAPPALAPSSLRLRLVASVRPPTISGEVVQATSVWATRDDRAIVSYNTRGAQAIGGLDYFRDLQSRRPRLRSSISSTQTDANAVFTDGRYAFLAASTTDQSLPAPAALDRIGIRGDRFRLDETSRMPLTSFAATGAMATNSDVYVTSGNTGHVFAFDAGNLSLQGQFALDDARWVAWDEDNGRVVVLQGTPGRLSVFAEGDFPGGSMNLLNTWSFPGADVAESKSTVEVVGGKAFVAAGPAGVQIVCLDTGEIVGSVPRPDPASLGLDPSVVVTNAVTVEDDLMFISNGEAGVYAAAAAEDFDSTACNEPQQITVLGQLQFGDLESVNHVVYRDDFLFVAAGLGGTKIVYVQTN